MVDIKRPADNYVVTSNNSRSKNKNTTNKRGLPPWLGKTGSLVFFLTLFGLANPNEEGYAQFRKCHGNCVNGVLHAIGMPLAVSGVFLIVQSVSNSANFTRILQLCVTTIYLWLYLQYENNPWSPWLFYALYMSIFDGILYHHLYTNHRWNRLQILQLGVFLVLANVGALEAIGHGFHEHHHSYVDEFFNSVFHTPLYGINSVMGYVLPRPDHVCW